MKKLFYIMLASMLVSCGGNQPQSSTPVTFDDTIQLLQPNLKEGLTINEALSLRASSRDYSSEPLSLEELSGALWAAAGVNRPENNHLTAPSAMAVYPIDVYAFTAEGVYLYNSQSHSLTRVVEGDHRSLSAAQDFANHAPLNLVYVADLGRYAKFRMERTKLEFLAGQDAAGYAENVNLYAAGNGLKSITRGSLKFADVEALLALDKDHVIVLAQTVGK